MPRPLPKSPQAFALALRFPCSRMALVRRRSATREYAGWPRRPSGEARATLASISTRHSYRVEIDDPMRVVVPPALTQEGSDHRELRELSGACCWVVPLLDTACRVETDVTHSKQRTGVMSTRHSAGAPSSSKPKLGVNQNQVFIAVSHSKQTNEIANKCQE